MPVKGTDLDGMTFMIRDNEGREWILPGTLETAEIEDESYGDEFRDVLSGIDLEMDIHTEIKYFAGHIKGMFDHLLCRPTMAAYRYVRSQKRKKEKERREKLKGGI